MNRCKFNDNWDFAFWEHGDFLNDWELKADWKSVTIPHDFSICQQRKADCRSYRDGGYFPGGFGIYRKFINVTKADLEREWYLEFEGVYYRAQVRLNGNVLGMHPHGYTSFYYSLNDYLVEGENEILVYVDTTCLPNTRWYSGSGIYRNVWLCDADKLHIKTWGVTVSPVQNDGVISVNIDTRICGEACGETLKYTICDAEGKEVAQKEVAISDNFLKENIVIDNPILWDLENPYLYSLHLDIVRDGAVVDTYDTNFGLRFVTVDAKNGFRLNGKTIKLKGGCVHHDNGIIGAASYAHSEERKVRWMKESGYNAIRCAHNPPATDFLDACDRLGMLVIDEAFDVWTRAKKRYDYHAYFQDWWQRDLDSMVYRDFNHPSVVIWSIGNEIPEQALKSGAQTARRLGDYIRSLDYTRPITQAVDNAAPVNDPVFETLDICGYNYGYQSYETDIERLPNRIIMGTESVAKHAWENWSLVEKHPNVIGDFVWTSIDYLGEAALGRAYYLEDKDAMANMSPYPWNKAYCGDIDLLGHKRPQSYFRDIMWGVRENPYIAVREPAPEGFVTERVGYWAWHDNLPSWDWKGYEGRTMLVDVYAPGEEVELFLNGRSLGVKKLGREPLQAELVGERSEDAEIRSHYAALFEVPYEPGELTAVASNGKKFSLFTSGEQYKLRLTPDKDSLNSKGDILFVDIDIVDEKGNIHCDFGKMATVDVSGGIELLAIGSGDPKDEELYVGNVHSAWRGQLQIAVRSIADKDGTIKVTVDGIPSEELTIKVK